MSSEYEVEIGKILPKCHLIDVCNVRSLVSPGVTCINIRIISHQVLTQKSLDEESLCILQHKMDQIMYYIYIFISRKIKH